MELILDPPVELRVADDHLRRLSHDPNDVGRYQSISILRAQFAAPGVGFLEIINGDGLRELIDVTWFVAMLGTEERAAAVMNVPELWTGRHV